MTTEHQRGRLDLAISIVLLVICLLGMISFLTAVTDAAINWAWGLFLFFLGLLLACMLIHFLRRGA